MRSPCSCPTNVFSSEDLLCFAGETNHEAQSFKFQGVQRGPGTSDLPSGRALSRRLLGVRQWLLASLGGIFLHRSLSAEVVSCSRGCCVLF